MVAVVERWYAVVKGAQEEKHFVIDHPAVTQDLRREEVGEFIEI